MDQKFEHIERPDEQIHSKQRISIYLGLISSRVIIELSLFSKPEVGDWQNHNRLDEPPNILNVRHNFGLFLFLVPLDPALRLQKNRYDSQGCEY
jgi:hypothetical protein